MATLRKIDLMHHKFGKLEGHKCGECSNLVRCRYHNLSLRKCSIYGLTHSAASDWANRYTACGMFNKEWTGGQIIREVVSSGRFSEKPVLPLDGQIGLFEGDV